MPNAVLQFLRLATPEASASVWGVFSTFLEGKSDNTKKVYRSILRKWCFYLGRDYESHKAERAIIAAGFRHAHGFRASLLKENQANATVFQRLICLKTFYDHMAKLRLITKNPFDDKQLLAIRRENKRDLGVLSAEQAKRLLALPNARTKDGERDLAVFTLLLGGGLRRSEAANLKMQDVRFARDELYLVLRKTKSGRDYDHALPDWAQQNIKRFYDRRVRQRAKADDPFLVIYFSGSKTRQLTDKQIYRLWQSYTKSMGLKVSPHAARATAITQLLDSGCTHREVMQFSRHASVLMVEKYDRRRTDLETSPAKKLKF